MIDLSAFHDELRFAPVASQMADCGMYFFDSRLPANDCKYLRDRMDELNKDEDVEVNYGGSEHRIWQAHKKDAAFAEFEKLSNSIIPKLYGRPSPAHNVLAIRNYKTPPNAERMTTRWHLDSFRKQLKLFAFLTDVADNNGPLEVVPNTHDIRFKLRALLPMGYYRLRDIPKYFQGRRSWQSIHNDKVRKLINKGFEVKPITVPAGTLMLIDTSALHRASPCLADSRYAVTVYHR